MSLESEQGAFVFFSYAHQDKWLRDRLEEHLSNLKYRGLITTWHDREIRAGEEWTRQIDIYLNKAHIILLLISSHFMASEYCYSREMKQALERRERKEADVIPILLRPVLFTDAPFAKLQMLPTNGKPVMRWRDRDSAFFDIACGIEKVAQKYSAPAPPPGWRETAWPHIEPITHPRVFLSAAPADADFADRLAADLKSRDIVVWTEQHTPDNSQTTTEEGIRQAISAAQAVVLVVSSQTRSSPTVKEHLRLADLYQRQLLLVWVGDDEHAPALPPEWHETVWVDAHETHHETHYAAALDTIEATLGPSGAAAQEEARAPRNPYKGLHAFTANDAGDFFGRERLVGALVKDVAGIVTPEQPANEGRRLLTIIGPSGCGKSSVVLAGLLPSLQHGALPGSETWVYLEPIVPGNHPLEAIQLALAPHFPERGAKTLREDLEEDSARGLHLLTRQLVKPPAGRVLLVIDQFEEIFTQTSSEQERQRFIELLVTAATEPQGPVIIVLTLRTDFYERLLSYPDLFRLIEQHHHVVLPMQLHELREIIEQPAALPDVHVTFEGQLVGYLLFEAQGQVRALPLLEFTLDQLFQQRSDRCLTLAAYQQLGGIKGALAKHAEATYAALPSDEHRKLARALFLRLIEPGATEQDTTRRRAALSEFVLADATSTRLLRETAEAFIEARLLTTNEVAGTTTIELSHEAVIREWIRLADWILEAREEIRQLQAIRGDTAEWIRQGRPMDRLYRGSQLKEARAWARRNMPSSKEVAFLQASAAEQAQQKALTTPRTVLVGFVAAIITAGILALLQHPTPIPLVIFLFVFNLGLLLLIAGIVAKVIGIIHARSEQRRAEAARKRRYYEEAIEAYEHALLRNPSDGDAHRGMGNALSALGHYDEAVNAFLQATQYNPTPAAYAGLGDTFAKLKRYSEAVVAYEKAIELDPTVTLNYDDFMQSLRALGREEEAEQAHTRAKQLGYEDDS